MTTKLVYGIVFFMAFLFVTITIIYLNSLYVNIFDFNFTSVDAVEVKKKPIKISDSLKGYINKELKDELLDSLYSIHGTPRVDTIYADVRKDSLLLDSMSTINKKINKIEQELVSKNSEIINLTKEKIADKDSTYLKWKGEMVKIYESMDSRAAAKLIQNLADNLARDILFTMKKKKAAEILMRLNPETASRITRLD